MSAHIAPHHPVIAGERRYPVMPEFGAAADAVLQPDSIFVPCPRIGVVVQLVVHFAIVGIDFRHLRSSCGAANRDSATRLCTGAAPRSNCFIKSKRVVMKIKRMGRTGLKVSEICLGTMTFGQQCDESTSFAIMDAAVEHGVNVFDTADGYPMGGNLQTFGCTEIIVGKWLK